MQDADFLLVGDVFSEIHQFWKYTYFLFADTSGVLALLIWVTVALAVLSLLFAGVALTLHFRERRKQRDLQGHRESWRQGLLGVLAGEQSPSDFSAEVGRRHQEEFLSFLVPYATTVQGEATRQIQEVARPFLGPVRQKLSSSRPLVRAQAVQRLGLLGGPAYADDLRERLDDTSPQVVVVAARRVAKLGAGGDTERILSALGRLSHVDRRQVSSALVELGDGAAPALRSALASENRSSFVRVCCAEALRWLGDSDAAEIATGLLRPAGSEEAPLDESLNDERPNDERLNERPHEGTGDPELTAALLRLLRRVGQGQKDREVVGPYLASPVSFVRIHAARAIGRLGDKSVEPELAALVRGDESRWVALSAARSLIELGALRSLRQLRASDHPRASLVADLLPAPE